MKLIFLDIDGVLNHEHFNDRSRLHRGHAICPVAVQNLREIIKRTGAKIILSSTWRRGIHQIEIRELFSHYDLDQYILGKIGILENQIRGNEIKELLDGCDEDFVESFVTLDDDDDMGDLLPFLVQTVNEQGIRVGLMADQREEAIKILLANETK
jgi:hypothetical protein